MLWDVNTADNSSLSEVNIYQTSNHVYRPRCMIIILTASQLLYSYLTMFGPANIWISGPDQPLHFNSLKTPLLRQTLCNAQHYGPPSLSSCTAQPPANNQLTDQTWLD